MRQKDPEDSGGSNAKMLQKLSEEKGEKVGAMKASGGVQDRTVVAGGEES